eukprot:1366816-Pleurochrysis_carterae.AAC.1
MHEGCGSEKEASSHRLSFASLAGCRCSCEAAMAPPSLMCAAASPLLLDLLLPAPPRSTRPPSSRCAR